MLATNLLRSYTHSYRYHYFFCLGYEARGSPCVGILANEDLAAVPQALHFARNAERFTSVVTIYTNGFAKLRDEILDATGHTAKFLVKNWKIKQFLKGEESSEVIV